MASGIYVIVNKVNNKQYVGSALDLDRRKTVHFTKLRCGRHDSRHLQAAFKKHGEDAFSFSVLEEVTEADRDALLQCEQKWIDILRPGYNKRLVADSNLGVPMSEEQKAHQSANAKAWRRTPAGQAHAAALAIRAKESWADPEKRAKRLEAVRAAWTPEKRAAQSEYNKRNQRHLLIDGEHFGSRRVWTDEEKARAGAKQKANWSTRAPVSEDDIRALVTSTNPAWSVRGLQGVRSLDKVLIYCETHDHAQWQTVAKVRHEHRGCKLCGYQRSSAVQAGRPKQASQTF